MATKKRAPKKRKRCYMHEVVDANATPFDEEKHWICLLCAAKFRRLEEAEVAFDFGGKRFTVVDDHDIQPMVDALHGLGFWEEDFHLEPEHVYGALQTAMTFVQQAEAQTSCPEPGCGCGATLLSGPSGRPVMNVLFDLLIRSEAIAKTAPDPEVRDNIREKEQQVEEDEALEELERAKAEGRVC